MYFDPDARTPLSISREVFDSEMSLANVKVQLCQMIFQIIQAMFFLSYNKF